MGYYEKVFLLAYPHLTSIIEDMDKLVCQKAYSSFSNNVSCLDLSEKIIKIIDKKDRLIDLKLKLDEIFKNFTAEELWLAEQKYFKRKAVLKSLSKKVTVSYTLRTYFRKQNKLLEKFSKSLFYNGMTESWFLEKYGDIEWLGSVYSRLKCEENSKNTVKTSNTPLKKIA